MAGTAQLLETGEESLLHYGWTTGVCLAAGAEGRAGNDPDYYAVRKASEWPDWSDRDKVWNLRDRPGGAHPDQIWRPAGGPTVVQAGTGEIW